MLPGETVLSGAKSHAEDPNVSPLKVMRSAAGWYVGTTYNGEWGEEPNSRETEYFKDESTARAVLESLVLSKDGKDQPWVRK